MSAAHVCHAHGCTVPVHPRFLMCRPHWAMVPPGIQQEVYTAYRPGQEVRKDPTPEYMTAYHRAINAVAAQEQRPLPFPI